MASDPDALRDAKTHSRIGRFFGWAWPVTLAIGAIWLIGAIFGDFSWWVAVALLLASAYFRAAAAEYKRASERSIKAALASDQAATGPEGIARPAGEQRDVDIARSREEADQRMSWARSLVNKYAALLETPRATPYIAEGSLPAPKDDIKKALLIVAAWEQLAGSQSKEAVGMYRNAFTLLMNVVPDAQATGQEGIAASLAKTGGADKLSAPEVMAMLKQFKESFPQQVGVSEGAALALEFDQRLAAMVATFTAS